jgi:hypothetical protein
VRELHEARENLAREKGMSKSLRAELEAAYVARAAAERFATHRLEELDDLQTVLDKTQIDIRQRREKQQRVRGSAGGFTGSNARANEHPASCPSGVILVSTQACSGGGTNAAAAGDVGASRTVRERLLETLQLALDHAAHESGTEELRVHERAMLETLREEVERQKAMRLAAAHTTDAAREVELEALRDGMAAAEARHGEAVHQLSLAAQRESLRLVAAHDAQVAMLRADAEKRLAASAASAAATETALQAQLRGGGAAEVAQTKKNALEMEEVTRRADAEVERVVASQRYFAQALWDMLGGMREHAASVLADATVLAPAQGVAASASADHPAATLEAIRALSAQCLGAAQRAADMMARRVWVACTIASQYLDLEPPPQLVVDSTSALPAFATAHATLLEQLLSVLRTALGSRGRPVSEDARADAAAGAPAMGLIAPHTDLSVEISRRGQTTHMPRAQSNPPHDQKQDARNESSARKSEARREEYVEARKRSQMLAMESFAKISYSGSQFGELRSCLDTAPTARPASADAAKMQSRSVAAWPGTRPASSLAAVASLCDVVYSSGAQP